MSEKESEKSGSQPENKEEVKDEKVESSPTEDVKEKSSDSEVPWHKDPRFKDELDSLKLGKSVKELIKANGLEDVDELKDLINSGAKVKGKQVDLDRIDEILEKANTLDKYQNYWKQQEELRRRGAETPEETIARLQRDIENRDNENVRKMQQEREAKLAKESVDRYEREVISQLESFDDLTPEVREVIAWSLGKGNECNEIDINDRKAIKKIVNDGVGKYNNLVKTIKEQGIKEYLAGKASIPSVPSTTGTVATSKVDPPKGFRAMREAAKEMIMGGKK
jgi:hypothetical protein